MANTRHIAVSTTDAIPGISKPTVRSAAFWSSGHETMTAAAEWIQQNAAANDFDAVVGLRFEAHPAVSYGFRTFMDRTSLRWAVYGTAVAW